MSILTMQQIYQMVLSAYNSIANSYADAYSENDEVDFKYFDFFINHLPGKNILDMGCGVGVNTNFLSNKGFNVVGIDASENMLINARKSYPALNFKNQNILHTSYPDNSFNGIVLAYVIEHFNDEGLLLLKNEITRLLCDGGLLFITSHEGKSEEIIADPLDENVSIYYNFMTKEKIDSIFSGFSCVSYYSRPSYGPEEFLSDKMFITYKKSSN